MTWRVSRRAKGRPRQRRIARRLQQRRATPRKTRIAIHSPALPRAAVSPPGGEIDRERDHHQVAHVARPGGADIDAVIREGEARRSPRRAPLDEIVALHSAHIRARGHQVDQPGPPATSRQRGRDAEAETPGQRQPRRAREGAAVARADRAAAELLGRGCKAVEEERADAASDCAAPNSPRARRRLARAPCAAKKPQAAISAAVRIMMSRLITNRRTSWSRSNSGATASVRRTGHAQRDVRARPRCRRSAITAASAAPATPSRNQHQQDRVSRQVDQVDDDLQRQRDIPARAIPTNQPSSA